MSGGSSAPRLLVDASIWIEYYRPDGRPEIRDAVREELLAGGVATTGLIAAEAVGAECELWHQDAHFERIADAADLRQRGF